MKRTFRILLILAALALPVRSVAITPAELDDCCAHAGGLHGRICCVAVALIDWWEW